MEKVKQIKKITWLFLSAVLLFGLLAFRGPQVNAAGAYSIQVNKGTNVVTVFDSYGNAIKAMPCSTGYATPLGTYGTKAKYRWWELDGPSYGQYCTRITGHILFHSVWYYAKDPSTQATKEFNKLGTTASHGCVRLATADSKWIYDNCVVGTTVNIISGTAANDPLGKPEMIKVSTASRMDWDPTDPDIRNPYNYRGASVDVSAVPRTVSYKQVWSGPYAVKAYDTCGNDISSRVIISGKVNTKKLGRYSVSFSVTDALGRSASQVVSVEVKDTYKAKITGVKSKKTIEYKSSLKLKKGVKAKAVSGKNLTSKIKVYIKAPGTSKYKYCKSGKYQFKKTGTFKVKYTVKNPYNKKLTSKIMKVVVRDTKAPKISGVSKKTLQLEAGSSVNLTKKVKAKLVSGKNITSRLKVTLYNSATNKTTTIKSANKPAKNNGVYTFKTPATYIVTYSVTNPTSKKKTTLSKTYIVKDLAEPVICGVRTVAQTESLGNHIFLFEGVTAKLQTGADVTSTLKATVSYAENGTIVSTSSYAYNGSTTYTFEKAGTYSITYTATNPNNGKTTTAQVTYIVEDRGAPETVESPTQPSTQEDSSTQSDTDTSNVTEP